MDFTFRAPFDHPNEECGVIGVFTPEGDASRLAFFGLFALQHRGQESAGIAAANGENVVVHADMGLVTQIFREPDFYPLVGDMAIGHTRYSTSGSSELCNAQPLLVDGQHGQLAVANNGNIINALQLRDQLQDEWNCTFTSTTDTEVIAQLLAHATGANWEDRVFQCMRQLEGAYSIVVQTKDTMIAARDPLGIRPLCLGKLNGGWVVASESCALDHIGAEYIRELDPGEVIIVDGNGLHSATWSGGTGRQALCVFELIYFARPDSLMAGQLVHSARQELGAQLAREHPVDADLVIGIPDSSTAAAVGYAQESGIPFSEGLVKNRYVGRTFIEPEQRLRDLGVRQKFNTLVDVIQGKRLVVVDDSIVRGTTTPHVVNLLRKGGAKEVHMRVCAPPIKHPCFMGVDMASREELLAANNTLEDIRTIVGADTLGYLSVEGLLEVVGGTKGGFCDACFTGNYPVPVQLELSKLALVQPGPAAD
ncbi:MAG: amidophosphoribosyltransferase [SAR202 cluster bacterium]|nr:amidophosphoribosyltransferase [Dehalococcoidia bacterium]MQF92771.1 amidophosphoribosyltransferase [SAR202 cluster bacterium]MCH2500983.1 amidophosphoribosyltransferase [Dehalococcoidia bacterium]MQG13170.1 amidophosphoribosyltransferase [SAR202 cluster bacterium]MQG31956.1 amidophosphoribosyltransferase [SAR202 cluster bacterium]